MVFVSLMVLMSYGWPEMKDFCPWPLTPKVKGSFSQISKLSACVQ